MKRSGIYRTNTPRMTVSGCAEFLLRSQELIRRRKALIRSSWLRSREFVLFLAIHAAGAARAPMVSWCDFSASVKRPRTKPVPAGISLPMITFSFRPYSGSSVAGDGCAGQHLDGVLEGGGRQERVGAQRGLGDAQQHFQELGRALAFGQQLLVDVLAAPAGPPGRRAGSLVSPGRVTCTLDIILRMITSKCLSLMFWPCERYTFCTSVSRYIWQAWRALDAQDAVRVERAFGQRLAGFDMVAIPDQQAGSAGDLVLRFLAVLVRDDHLLPPASPLRCASARRAGR